MNRLFTITSSIFLVLIGFNLAAADEAENLFKYFSWWDGEWEVEIKIDGEVETVAMTIEPHEPGCHTVKDTGISVWGYDPHLKTWVGSGFNAEGARFTNVLEPIENEAIAPGVVDKSKIEFLLPDGTKVFAEATWNYKDDNTVIIEQIRKTASGEALPKVVVTCKRKVSTQASAEKWLKFYVGRWEVQEQWRAYPVGENADDAEWNRYQTVTDWKNVPDVAAITVMREPPNASTSTLGWDPVKQAIVQTGYLGNGSCFRIEFGQLDETEMTGALTISFANGESGTGTFKSTRIGDNEYRTEWNARATDDMVLEGSAVFTR